MPLAALENQERIFPNWVTLLERSLNTFNKSKNPAAVHRLTKITVSAAHIQDVVSYTVLNTTVLMRMRTLMAHDTLTLIHSQSITSSDPDSHCTYL